MAIQAWHRGEQGKEMVLLYLLCPPTPPDLMANRPLHEASNFRCLVLSSHTLPPSDGVALLVDWSHVP